MHNRIKLVLIVSLLLTITMLVLGAFKTRAQQKTAALIASQGQDRIVVTKTHLRPPLEIAVVKTQKGQMETDKEFVGDDDWLRGLTIRLANNSGKTVTFIGMELVFWRTKEQSPGFPAAWGS